ncbi:MAG: pmm, phosphomannomutase, phosphomannomutase [Candidatus Saccharibacteria bacterium]|nr:pmm, phosphomannomutase, phosphomannomutase [Candidatus Saccharibacteria bacterium]
MPLSKSAAAHLSNDSVKNINDWLTQPKYEQYKSELEQLIANEKWQELEDSFFKVIEFGTAGRRGTTGIGSNRINRVTIGESAQALCDYADEFDALAKEKGVVIACDTRLSSPELSRYVAQVCAASGFKTYIFDSFRATPELSFAVRYLKAAVGIVVSASHNPPADNGFKAYWSDGAQLVSPHAEGVIAKAAAIREINEIDFDHAVTDGSIIIIGDEVDKPYLNAVVEQAEGSAREIKIVYSPLHGAGQTNVLPSLRQAGFESISVVEQQMTPDGNFPTIENYKPNPEEKVANDLAVAMMIAESADIAITNDPDADRIGVMVRNGKSVIYLSGNQSAALAADYVLSKKMHKGQLNGDQYIVKTIVTTDLLTSIANRYNVKIYGNFLVGFKYIGELILQKETTSEEFVMGAEESFGLLKGDYARDKDGATGALPLAEFAAELKLTGKTLYDRLLELYAEHGLYIERLDNVQSPGADGFERMQQIMSNLRTSPPKYIGGHEVTAILDYKTLHRQDLRSGETSEIDLINGNVVVLELGDYRRRVTIRPSGTEPKIKFYVQWYEDAISKELNSVENQYKDTADMLEGLSKELEDILFG